jgi:glutathione S-transferase
VARIFALELGVACSLEVVRNLQSTDPSEYGDNPALKLPVLATPEGNWFGALNICREVARRANRTLRLVWPEDLTLALLSNAQELVTTAMSTEVSLIMAGAEAITAPSKMRTSLVNSVEWLEQNLDRVISSLPPERDLSYLETTLYCLGTHLPFRGVLSTEPYPRLTAFCARFGERAAARATEFAFDA